ncbi:carbon-nitrogen hydrolase family protein [Candidatus Woesearchaeota archaeon]|nr:carbon-nitrogen hydrolase family protein [Candidatus Woesearchaeota archaeon]
MKKAAAVMLAQTGYLDVFQSQSSIEKIFNKACSNNADIVVFPECFLQEGISKKRFSPKAAAQAKSLFSYLSRKCRVCSIMGSVVEKAGNKLFNLSYLFGPDGAIIGHYDKVNLNGNERKWITPGNKYPVFKTPFGKIGLMICRDLLYPEAARALAKNGAEIIFCPSHWSSYSEKYPAVYRKYVPKGDFPKEVDALVQARAFENGVAVVFVNGVGHGKGKKGDIPLGRTQIAVPFFGAVKKLSHCRERVLEYAIDLKIIRDAKKGYGFSKISSNI